jgi:hypothetical protein
MAPTKQEALQAVLRQMDQNLTGALGLSVVDLETGMPLAIISKSENHSTAQASEKAAAFMRENIANNRITKALKEIKMASQLFKDEEQFMYVLDSKHIICFFKTRYASSMPFHSAYNTYREALLNAICSS